MLYTYTYTSMPGSVSVSTNALLCCCAGRFALVVDLDLEKSTPQQDSFQQHDVQELCRVLFDALESTFQGTVNEKLVNNLYQGELS